jgi:hypothetical protein
MIGLYILTSLALEYENKAFKFGMSMRLHERWYDYSDTFSDPRYHCIFKINSDLNDKNVKFLEGEILKKTNEYRKDTLGNEYRDTNKISYIDFIKISEQVLKEYGINYNIEYNLNFDKPERMINENTDIDLEPLVKKINSPPLTPPDSPVVDAEPNKLILRDEVQKSSHNIFVKKLDINEYFQGIYNIATGIGKTYIAYANCLYHLFKYPNDNILWITYKHEIINSQDTEYLGDKLVKFDEQNIDYINSLSGKVIIVLRQKLQFIYDKLNKNLIHGIIYDECHDACKVSIEKIKIVDSNVKKTTEGKTFDMLIYLEQHNNLKYRNGYSATPLTSSKKQNAGLLQLYGCSITNKINYLYTCNIIDGVNKKLILEPNIKFCPIKDIHLLNNFDQKIHSELIDNIIDFIKNIIIKDKFYYKKFIVWFPTIEISQYFYNIFEDTNIKKFISNSNIKNDDEKNFKIIKKNAIMFACDKFTTGFNGDNLECGINFRTNEEGHRIAQKLGRFTRLKENQNTAYLYQVIENNEEEKFINNIIKCLEGLGVSLNEINRFVRTKDSDSSGSSGSSKIKLNLEKFDLTINILQNRIDFMLSDDNINNKIKRLIRKYNDSILNDNIHELIHNDKFIFTKNKIIQFIKSNKLFEYIGDFNISENIFIFSFSQKLYDNIKSILYSQEEFAKICDINNINSTNYKDMTKIYKKLPSWNMIDLGYYNGKTFSAVLNSNIVCIDGF